MNETRRRWVQRLGFLKIEYLLVLGYAVVLSYLSAVRYWSFTDAWDMGGFVQAIWSGTQGHLLDYTVNSFFYAGFPAQLVHSFLGTHFSPILFVLVPVYALLPDPVTLLVAQSLVIALGLLPIFWLSKRNLGRKVGLMMACSYAIYPPVIGMSLNNFHPEAFIPTFVMFGIYFAVVRRWLGVVVASALVMAVIEEGGYVVAALAVFMVLEYRPWRRKKMIFGLALLAIVSVAYAIAATAVRANFGLNVSGFTLTLNSGNFRVLGANFPDQILRAAVGDPSRALQALTFDGTSKLLWLATVFEPVLFLSFVSPAALFVAAPYFLVSLLSNYPGYYSTFGVQQAFAIGAIYPAAILGLNRLQRRGVPIEKVVAILLIVSLAFVAVADFPASVYGNSFQVDRTAQIESSFVSLIPNNASVLTTSDIFPHVANRLNAYTIPPATLRPGYASIDSEILNSIDAPQYLMLNLGSSNGNVKSENRVLLSYAMNNTRYGILAYDEGVVLFELGFQGTPIVLDYPRVFNSSNLDFSSPTARNGSGLSIPVGTQERTMWFGPYAFLPKGTYTVTFDLEIHPEIQGSIALLRIDASWNSSNNILAQRTIYTSEFVHGEGAFTLSFVLTHPVFDLELRGIFPTSYASIALTGITVAPQ